MKKSLRKKWQGLHWYIIGASALISLVLGYLGFSAYYSALNEPHSKLSLFYLASQLFTLESGGLAGKIPLELEVARFLAPIVAATAALKALMAIFKEQAQLLRVKFFRNHIVICGLGRKGSLFVEKFRERGDRVVAIELDEGNDLLDRCRDQGAIVFTGDATEPSLLKKARINKASYLIAVCGDDGTNAEIAVQARSLSKRRTGQALTCIVHIVDPQLCSLLQEREIASGRSDAFRLEFFNFFERGAREWLRKYEPFSYLKENIDISPHFLIVGIGRFGESLISQSAILWKDLRSNEEQKLSITIVDRIAEEKKDMLCLRYPSLERYCDIIPIETDIHSPQFQRGEFLFDSNNVLRVSHIFICLDNDSLGLSAALAMNRHLREDPIPDIIRMAHDTGLASLLAGEETTEHGYANIKAFGLLDHTCHPDLILSGTNEILARAIHEEYLKDRERDRERTLETEESTQETDPACISWEELSEKYKESNRRQADHIGVKLRAVECELYPLLDWDADLFKFDDDKKEIERLARMEHERWMQERLEEGWKHTSGPKDPPRKRNPDLLPWDKLPDNSKSKQKSLDVVRKLPEFLAAAGFEIRRLAR